MHEVPAPLLHRGIDWQSDRAVFRQIADHLWEAIADGRLVEGDRLPSETELVAHYGVARGTVRQALTELHQEGLTVARHGRGVFVQARPEGAALVAHWGLGALLPVVCPGCDHQGPFRWNVELVLSADGDGRLQTVAEPSTLVCQRCATTVAGWDAGGTGGLLQVVAATLRHHSG